MVPYGALWSVPSMLMQVSSNEREEESMDINEALRLAAIDSGDTLACARECADAFGNHEISDGCARTIASMYHNGGTSVSASFATTGAISESTEVYRDLFDQLPYSQADSLTQLFMNMMGTYLTSAGRRGPVGGWSKVWVR